MAKSSPRAFLEERGPPGSCCAGEGLDPPMSWASCGISRRGAQPMQGQHPLPCSGSLQSLWYLLALVQDGHGHIWPEVALEEGEECGHACPACSCPPSTLVHTWAHGHQETQGDFHWVGRVILLWRREPVQGITWMGNKALPLYCPFLLSSSLPCFSHSKSLTEQYQEHNPCGQHAGFDPLCKGIPHPSPITGLSAHTSLLASPSLTVVIA